MRRPNNRRFVKREDTALHKINDKIIARQIRLVREGQEPTVMTTSDAIKLADTEDLDLVEISPKADPPVCKILDYKKFLYNQKKKQKEMNAKQSKVVLKEIRFGPNTDDHDFEFKLAHAKKFLDEGNKVKAFVFFRGRAIVFKEKGEILLLRLAQDLEAFGKVEHMPSMDGKKMSITLAPKK